MRNLLVIGALAVGLSACAGVSQPLQQSQVYDLENAYGLAQSAAIACVSVRSTGPCKSAKVVVMLHNDDVKARAALTALENFVRNPANQGKVNYLTLLSDAQQAIADFTAYETTNGVK